MLTKLKVQNLHERLACYFSSNKSEINEALFDMVMNTMIENVDFDVSKLSRAIEMLDKMKNNNTSTEYKHFNNMFDVSTQTSKTYVKGFLSKGFPMLYFYRQGEDLPFFKIKTLENDFGKNVVRIETASTAEALSEFKNGAIDEDSFYVRVLDIVGEKNGFSYHNLTRARAGKDDPFVMPKENFPDEYKLFYNFLQDALKSNGVELPDSMSATKFDFIFLEVYEKIKKCIGDIKDFTMSDLVLIMHSIINSKPSNSVGFVEDGTMQINENSFVARTIADLEYNENDRKKLFHSKDLTMKNSYDFSTVQATNYLSIDILKNGSPYSSYMMGRTYNGFTLFKANRADAKTNNNDFAMLTFNLTDNMFRFSAHYNERLNSKASEDIVMKISPTGELVLSSDIKRTKAKEEQAMARQVAMM